MVEKLREDYNRLFGQAWDPWVGGLLIGIINVFLFMLYQPWTSLDGIFNWGNSLLGDVELLSLGPDHPILRSGSVINIGLLFGAFLSALLAGQFAIRMAPRRELIKGAIGGILIGLGAVLVRGCNIGGFFSGTSALGLHGLTMGVGLAIGAFFGVQYLMWELEHTTDGGGKPATLLHNAKIQPYVGAAMIIVLLMAAFAYNYEGYSQQAIILLFGATLGVISQRSRVCFVRAFREPFLTGEASHTRAILLALLVSMVGIALVKYMAIEVWFLSDADVDPFLRPTFWIGSLTGGTIFGFGMVIAGGCGAGTIWRVGEGQVKLWMALLGYIFSAALFNRLLMNRGLINQLGKEAFLPDYVGWGAAIILMFAILILWYLFVQWNEETGRFTAL
jgi:uncharacterized membrane protein YedE/YeeE